MLCLFKLWYKLFMLMLTTNNWLLIGVYFGHCVPKIGLSVFIHANVLCFIVGLTAASEAGSVQSSF